MSVFQSQSLGNIVLVIQSYEIEQNKKCTHLIVHYQNDVFNITILGENSPNI